MRLDRLSMAAKLGGYEYEGVDYRIRYPNDSKFDACIENHGAHTSQNDPEH